MIAHQACRRFNLIRQDHTNQRSHLAVVRED
jgi:hypothetical protein